MKAGLKSGIAAVRARPHAFIGTLLVVVASATLGSIPASASSILSPNIQVSARTHGVNTKILNSSLPSSSSDNIAIALPAGISLPRAEEWLAALISYRQTALFAAQNLITSSRNISAANRSPLVALEQSTASRLNTIAIRSLSDQNIAQVTGQANGIVSLEILNVAVPQLRLLARVDGDLGLLGQLSSTESAAATAIAISHQPQSVLRTCRQLDTTVQSLARNATTALLVTQRTLFQLTTASVTTASSTFASGKSANSTAISQLHLANDDLRQLVSLLAR